MTPFATTAFGTRGTFAMTLRRCLRMAALPTLLAGLVSHGLARWQAPSFVDGTATPGAASPWLELAMLVVAACVVATAIAFWPTFSTGRTGRDIVARLERDPWQGCAAVGAAALAAQFILTLPLATAFARGLGAPTTVRAHLAVAPPPSPQLGPEARQLRFELPAAVEAIAIELRPLAAPPVGQLRPSRVLVAADGEPLMATAAAFDQSGQMARIDFRPRPIRTLTFSFEEGSVPLFFPAGSVIVVASAEHGLLANGIWAALIALIPTFVALAIACLCGAAAALPVVATTALVVLFVLTIGGVGPGSTALLRLLRGQWIAGVDVFAASIPSLAAGVAAMIGSMPLRRNQRA
ncbi:MAG: hypothetical protein KDC98_12005 [Planctomycetes bacterium]|nr:hypothetical protein [Planctomycetota bacterium]